MIIGDTKVVNVRNEECMYYVGRSCGSFGNSEFYNPFKIPKDGDRLEVIQKFIHYAVIENMVIMRRAKILKGGVLGCWCDPQPCHGHFLALVAEGFIHEEASYEEALNVWQEFLQYGEVAIKEPLNANYR